MSYHNELSTVLESSYQDIKGFNVEDFVKTIIPQQANDSLIFNWIRFSLITCRSNPAHEWLAILNENLELKSFINGNDLCLGDIFIFLTLHSEPEWLSQFKSETPFKNLVRYYNFFISNSKFQPLLKNLMAKKKITFVKEEASSLKFEEGGKFEPLPGAVKGKVVVRFPPEASGFIHIGHAKAALLNHYYKEVYDGKLILRFDDTNPAKEKEDYEKAILEDLPKIGFKHDIFSYTSDHFELMLKYCEKLIKENVAYADDTNPELMKEQRERREESACRSNTVEENLRKWNEMLKGSPEGQKCCIRVKIDMKSDNGALRDPTIYRCKTEPHTRTGNKYKAYPTYDFACPIVDSIEGVTHSLRTSEYNDRNDQYYWMCDALGLRKPIVYDYSRLALQNTLLSKRKLTYLVEEGFVTGWDDPRMPTVRGILRHGMTPEGLRSFIIAQGSSRSVTYMEWDKLWSFNKKYLEVKSKRYTSLQLTPNNPATLSEDIPPNGLIRVKINGQTKVEKKSIPNHPKDESLGFRDLWVGPLVFVEYADALSFVPGQNVTFINWGNMKVDKINQVNSRISDIEVTLNITDTDFKKTPKINWLVDSDCDPSNKSIVNVPINCIFYSHVLTKAVLSKDDDFKNFINKSTRKDECHLGDPLIGNVKKGEIIQLMRKGFFICDEEYKQKSDVSDGEQPCVLIYIPDGSVKEKPETGIKVKMEAAKGDSKKESEKKKTPNPDNLTPEEREKAEKKAREKEEKKLARKAGKDAAKKAKENPDEVSQEKKLPQPPKEEKQITKDNQNQQPKKNKTVKPQASNAPKTEQPAKKKQTKLGIGSTKSENPSEWYTQVITKSEMLEYYDVSGCYILRPWAYYIWTCIQGFINFVIEDMGVENTYFPMFVSKTALEKEKNHIADFSPEVAWVTKSGSGDLAEPVAIRPTSETIMYPSFAKWVQSHRDLPIKINQWSNVVRWEFKQPSPFLRTREFLWQEGHTAYEKKPDAEEEIMKILQMYADVYEGLLAIPVVKGRKTEKEKFAGADYTTTVEAYVPSSGRGIQGATSHHLGQNFSKMFDVQFENPVTREKEYVYQNSWGLTTRTIGVMIMVHGDDQGLVLPPRIARHQLVIVPCGITATTSEEEKVKLIAKCRELHKRISVLSISETASEFVSADRRRIRCHLDDADNVSPGWKFNHWELKGVPVRIEMGFKDMANEQVIAVIRHNGEKRPIKLSDIEREIPKLLDQIHDDMYNKALNELKTGVKQVSCMDEMKGALDQKSLVILPFCLQGDCEEKIKEITAVNQQDPGNSQMGAKSLCIPFEDKNSISNFKFKLGACDKSAKCINCSKPAISYTLFGRSY